jgi:hypothetical protein
MGVKIAPSPPGVRKPFEPSETVPVHSLASENARPRFADPEAEYPIVTIPPTSCPKSKMRREPFVFRLAVPGYVDMTLSEFRIFIGETIRVLGAWIYFSHGPEKDAVLGAHAVSRQHCASTRQKSNPKIERKESKNIMIMKTNFKIRDDPDLRDVLDLLSPRPVRHCQR